MISVPRARTSSAVVYTAVWWVVISSGHMKLKIKRLDTRDMSIASIECIQWVHPFGCIHLMQLLVVSIERVQNKTTQTNKQKNKTGTNKTNDKHTPNTKTKTKQTTTKQNKANRYKKPKRNKHQTTQNKQNKQNKWMPPLDTFNGCN